MFGNKEISNLYSIEISPRSLEVSNKRKWIQIEDPGKVNLKKHYRKPVGLLYKFRSGNLYDVGLIFSKGSVAKRNKSLFHFRKKVNRRENARVADKNVRGAKAKDGFSYY